MSRAVYPIIDILNGKKQPLPFAFADVFEAEGASREDEFTYTARFQVSDGTARDRIRDRLRAEDAAEADRLIALLDANDWSVSVLVDNY